MLYFRSCSGELNRLPRFYHSGETGDLDHVIRTLGAREPKLRLGAVGVSIGGNVLMKWLGEQGADAPAALAGAVGISVPFNLMACAHTMDRRPQRLLYTGSFMRSLRQKVTAKARVYPGFVDLDAVRRARTFAAYDRAVTAPLHGFADEEDYWRRASSLPYLTRVRRPTLLLSALDDPFIPGWSLPDPRTPAAGGAGGVRAARRPRGLRRGAAVARDLVGRAAGGGFPGHASLDTQAVC